LAFALDFALSLSASDPILLRFGDKASFRHRDEDVERPPEIKVFFVQRVRFELQSGVPQAKTKKTKTADIKSVSCSSLI
jgi:hypothetical protein